MNRKELVKQIKSKSSYLCVGLDTDIHKIPSIFRQCDDPIFEFNKMVIDATVDHCVSYKPNIAFYEAEGSKGWESLQKTIEYIPDSHFTIADAKRGDIGNTSNLYAKTFFKTYEFDSVTVAPYMGVDSVTPFLEYLDKWVILLGLTSNTGSQDFQNIESKEGEPLFESVLRKAQEWGSPDNLMFVIGATHPQMFSRIRKIAPNNFLLVPGVGTQGGDLESLSIAGFNDDIGLLVNSSRGIIYAGDKPADIKKAAETLHESMKSLLNEHF